MEISLILSHFASLPVTDRHMESVLGITLESVPPTRARGDSRESETQAKRKQKREALFTNMEMCDKTKFPKGREAKRRGREVFLLRKGTVPSSINTRLK